MLCDKKGKFVYEICPEYFGPVLTPEEVEYWEVYNVIEIAKVEDLDWVEMDLNDTVEEILRINAKRKSELKGMKYGKQRSSRI